MAQPRGSRRPGSARRRGAIAAAVTATGVLLVTLGQEVLVALVGIASGLSFPGERGTIVESILASAGARSVTASLPFAIGVFLSLWQLAPIAGGLRLGHVVSRALLATGIGGLATFVVSASVGVWRLFDAGYNALPGGSELSFLVVELVSAIRVAATVLVTAAPLVVLAGVLLWIWSRDRDRDVSGLLDL